MSDIVKSVKLVCVEFGDTNNNKYWQADWYKNGTIMSHWGRVGNRQSEKPIDEATAQKKIREKTNPNNKPDKLYTEVKTIDSGPSDDSNIKVSVKSNDLKIIAKKQIKYSSPLVQELIEFLTDCNCHNILETTRGSISYDTSTAQFKTPLGIVLPDQVQEARDILINIGDLVANKKWGDDLFAQKLNRYLRLIPHDMGRSKIDPYTFLPDLVSVQKENDLLDGLSTSFLDVTTQPKNDQKKDITEPKVFDLKLELVTDSKIVDYCNQKYLSTRKEMHVCAGLKMKRVYAVEMDCQKNLFEKVSQRIGKVMELWHGSSSCNLLSIMKTGLRTRPPSSAHVTGKMFGSTGIYFAPASTKSLNYATGFWGGGRSNRIFMFMVDVCLGKFYVPRSSCDDFPKPGYDSTWAKSGVSGVCNDEIIVYNDDRCNLKFLLEFS